MRKPKSAPPKHQVHEVTGPMPFKVYSAGPEQAGGGYLVFQQSRVTVVLKRDSAWRQATKAKRKNSNKLTNPDRTWKVWFLLARAFELSKESIGEHEREIGPADSEKQASNQLKSAAKIESVAADARMHAILQASVIGEEIPTEAASSNREFVKWFEKEVSDRLEANDLEFIEAVNGFKQAASRLPNDYPKDLLQFREALREQAMNVGGPPTKESVRLALGRILQQASAKAKILGTPASDRRNGPSQSETASDIIDPDTFTRLLQRAGFGWLPNGKPGPRLQKKAGKGTGMEELEVHSSNQDRRRASH